jgi:hypothetical protein
VTIHFAIPGDVCSENITRRNEERRTFLQKTIDRMSLVLENQPD